MLKFNIIRKLFALCLLLTVSGISSTFVIASETQQQQTAAASISVTGDVMVDNHAALSNSTIASGSTITTGEKTNSIATIDLGRLGRVELLSQSSLVLKFDNNGIYGTLLVGKARVMNSPGVTTTISTKEGIVMSNTAQANTFTVETECGRTAVNTTIGSALLRAEGQDRQVAAGSESVAGNLQQTGCRPCVRPFPNAPFPTVGALPLVILGAAGVAIAFLARRNETERTGNNGTGLVVVSPTR